MKANIGKSFAALIIGLSRTTSASFVPRWESRGADIDLDLDLDPATEDFSWDTIRSSSELQYHKCYGSFECSKLTVPLDWTNQSNPNSVTLALVRLPAVVDVTDESFGGTIIINPGGPSGSGVVSVLQAGRGVQRIVDSDKHFEILSFDPRGVAFSTPSLACFQDDAARLSLSVFGVGAGSLEASRDALNVKWGIDESLGRLCESASNGHFPDGSNIRQFVSTALAVRDMVEIVDQVDAHLRKEVSLGRTRLNDRQTVMAVGPKPKDPALLNYWGLSYGTYLGNTFASMFPERVGRMVLDGVVDADDYTATGWTTNLQDNNQTWIKFFEFCFEAGSKCALFDPLALGPEEIRDKVDVFLAGLKDNPIPLIRDGNAYLLTYFELKSSIHECSYLPNLLWPLLAVLLQSLIDGVPLTAASALEGLIDWRQAASRHFSPALPLPLPFQPLQSKPPGHFGEGETAEPLPTGYPWQLEAGVSILCGDGEDITFKSKDDYAEYLSLLESQSPLVGAIWAEIILHCIHWPASVRPSTANRFTGPFQSNLSDYDPRGSPLLFIGNTADPVTPLRNALKMSDRHEGSVVLTQDLPGHCSGEANPSGCTFEILKAFFRDGTLPRPGLVCESARKPWDD
ncbi:hypothetical protein A1O3_07975 [Capronia epimyces CBS 606.96]|uniref:Peptidase S33 tripeptidyl aminopeptidase-like C-terminal domain-containing protein n=1 Tax=Capronia epimyces CBS 606.96 TaxID=1182542 RepID=W9XHH8_9EURO|nr:uncharacterized protein A1O3_07975 [Capronia epimyces CBS 606.96]EXJ79693.1 hypothetical protein A1O3_07975 [Capronia epimyces CBS 606.96]